MNEPLLLLPGMMCDARVFGPQIKHFGRDRAIHLPPISNKDTVGALAVEILTHAPDRFAIAGLSMGGIVALEIFRQAPRRVTRVALMDTNAAPEPPERAALREPQIARVKGGSLEEVMRDEMKPNYLVAGPGRQAILDLVMDMAKELGPDVFERQSRALQRRHDMQPILTKIKAPTLILCGEEDVLCPPERHRRMAEITPRSQLEIIKGAGHLPTLEQPDLVIAALSDWLSKEI